ncbi:MAG: hypothetical protein U0703_22740 [Anaerolineae bacterium]
MDERVRLGSDRTYDSSTDTNFREQNAWERVEIDLVTALEAVSGKTWATISGTPTRPLRSTTTTTSRYASCSRRARRSLPTVCMWTTSASTTDHRWRTSCGRSLRAAMAHTSIASKARPTSPTLAATLVSRRGLGTTSTAGYTRTGSQALTDSPSGNYTAHTFSVMEMIPLVDMTSTAIGSYPTMTFWTRYQIGSDAQFRVEIAYKDGTTASNPNNYNQIGGWSTWAAMPVMLDNLGDHARLEHHRRDVAARSGRPDQLHRQADLRALHRQRP